jgi:hypothetical protein
MGQGFYSQCNNNYGQAFIGSDNNDQCMYDMDNLNSLPAGFSSQYVEFKNSGGCLFDASYFFEYYSLPGSPAGSCYFILALGSFQACPLSISSSPPWIESSMVLGATGITAYIWTYPGSIAVTLDSFADCGDQVCIGWTIHPWGELEAAKPIANPQPVKAVAPAEGSDYQGDPKAKK